MGGVAGTLLTDLPGGEYPRLERDDLAPFTLLDLHVTRANRASFSLGDKFNTANNIAGFGRGPSNFRRRPTRTLRMSAQPAQ